MKIHKKPERTLFTRSIQNNVCFFSIHAFDSATDKCGLRYYMTMKTMKLASHGRLPIMAIVRWGTTSMFCVTAGDFAVDYRALWCYRHNWGCQKKNKKTYTHKKEETKERKRGTATNFLLYARKVVLCGLFIWSIQCQDSKVTHWSIASWIIPTFYLFYGR